MRFARSQKMGQGAIVATLEGPSYPAMPLCPSLLIGSAQDLDLGQRMSRRCKQTEAGRAGRGSRDVRCSLVLRKAQTATHKLVLTPFLHRRNVDGIDQQAGCGICR